MNYFTVQVHLFSAQCPILPLFVVSGVIFQCGLRDSVQFLFGFYIRKKDWIPVCRMKIPILLKLMLFLHTLLYRFAVISWTYILNVNKP